MMRPLTRQYQLKRADISLNYAWEYVRSFWWMIVGIPIFGLLALILGQDPVIKAVGLICALWPLTIPARSFILSSKASRQMLKPTTLSIENGDLLFGADDGSGTRLRRESVRSIRLRGGLYVIQTRMLAMALVPKEAFLSEAEEGTFLQEG